MLKEFTKYIENLPEDSKATIDDFYDLIEIPRKDRSDFATAALLKQYYEAREANSLYLDEEARSASGDSMYLEE